MRLRELDYLDVLDVAWAALVDGAIGLTPTAKLLADIAADWEAPPWALHEYHGTTSRDEEAAEAFMALAGGPAPLRSESQSPHTS